LKPQDAHKCNLWSKWVYWTLQHLVTLHHLRFLQRCWRRKFFGM
jgi:hypothetical protein